jgi:hypothetical protein
MWRATSAAPSLWRRTFPQEEAGRGPVSWGFSGAVPASCSALPQVQFLQARLLPPSPGPQSSSASNPRQKEDAEQGQVHREPTYGSALSWPRLGPPHPAALLHRWAGGPANSRQISWDRWDRWGGEQQGRKRTSSPKSSAEICQTEAGGGVGSAATGKAPAGRAKRSESWAAEPTS